MDKTDLKAASTYYEKSCDADYPSGCFVAGLMRLQSKDDDDGKHIPKAISLFDKACRLEDGEGCFRISTLYLRGQKVDKDLKKAFEYAVKGCNLDHVYSCNNLSLMFRHGNGVERNVKMADELKKRTLLLYEQETKIPPAIKTNQ